MQGTLNIEQLENVIVEKECYKAECHKPSLWIASVDNRLVYLCEVHILEYRMAKAEAEYKLWGELKVWLHKNNYEWDTIA